MRRFFATLYLTNRFFYCLAGVAMVLALGFWLAFLFYFGLTLLLLVAGLVLYDGFLLYRRIPLPVIRRRLPRILTLGDEARIEITLRNCADQPLWITIIDELPVQLQRRDFQLPVVLPARAQRLLPYPIRPLERGAFRFGVVNAFLRTRLGLLERRHRYPQAQELPVYPSVLQMKQHEFRAFDRRTSLAGTKRLRRSGQSYEFDQIKPYVRGDDYRTVNWRATGRRAQLMVNQFEDERAQQVYCLIDKSRNMLMPFDGLSLMDHAINTTLALSNVAMRKYDRAGLFTFSDKVGSFLKADNRAAQLQRILQTLYREAERTTEANFELLYYVTRRLITGRSLLLLFTNFESSYALDRALPVLRRINSRHLLVVIFFQNTQIEADLHTPAATVADVYRKTVARRFTSEKQAMVNRLRQYGISSLLVRPEELTTETINRYLAIKQRSEI
jgi:uncharacterized protein (DUF58 family)